MEILCSFGVGFFQKYIIKALSTCPKSLPDPVLSSSLSIVAFSDENSLGKKYQKKKKKKVLAGPSAKVIACTSPLLQLPTGTGSSR